MSAAGLLVGCLCATATLSAEEPAKPAQNAPGGDSLVYEVIEVEGRARVAPTGTDVMRDEGWTLIKQGDFIRAGQQLRVPTRSRVKLVARPAEPPTVVLFETSTLVNISELAMENGVARSRIQIAHGAVKAGVAEGEIRSDMEIESPTATLSKKGTDIFGMEVQPDGRFTMFLSEQGRGLVQGILTQSGGFGASQLRSRNLTPGQWITQQMARAIDNVQFDRKVLVNDVYGLTGVDQLFTLLNDRGGISFMLPTGNSPWSFFGNATPRDGIFSSLGAQQQNQSIANSFGGQGAQTIRNFSGGDFGIGQGQVPGVFGAARNIQAARQCTGSKPMSVSPGLRGRR